MVEGSIISKFLDPLLIACKWCSNKFCNGDNIFQRGSNISRKSGRGVHFLGRSKYIATDRTVPGC